jgi:hypothetical protein
MSMARYAILVVALVVLGLITIWEHLRLLSVGYEVNDLRKRRSELEETARVLDRRIDASATPARAAGMVRRLGIDLVPGHQERQEEEATADGRGCTLIRQPQRNGRGVIGVHLRSSTVEPVRRVVSPQSAGRPAQASPPCSRALQGARRDP